MSLLKASSASPAPAYAVGEPASGAAAPDAAASAAGRDGLRLDADGPQCCDVLIIGQEPSAIRALSRDLQGLGSRVHVCTPGPDALELASLGRWRMVVLAQMRIVPNLPQLARRLSEMQSPTCLIQAGVSDWRIAEAAASYARSVGQCVHLTAGSRVGARDFDALMREQRALNTRPPPPDATIPRQPESAFLEALRADEIVALYQPVYRVGGTLRGAEMLVRWRCPDGSLLAPDAFLPPAQAVIAHERLFSHLFCLAIRFLKTAPCSSDFQLALNVPASLARSLDWVEWVLRELHNEQLAPRRLLLEISECGPAASDAALAGAIAVLRQHGVDCALDDFGVGASSFNRLIEVPVNVMKLDCHTVWQCRRSLHARTLVRGIVDIAHQLDIQVVAEGIESTADFRTMTRLGGDLMQGFHFGAPMEHQALHELLRQDAVSVSPAASALQAAALG